MTDRSVKTNARQFVVVSGLPGSGKTTVARALTRFLNLPIIDKDDILERLFESRGVGDAAWRRQLSREADAILQADVLASPGAIVSSFWRVPGMPPDSGTPSDWLGELPGAIAHVYCQCPAAVAADRFVRRTRHAGHLDRTRSDADVLASIEALVPFTGLPIAPRVIVDTTRPLVAEAVARATERLGALQAANRERGSTMFCPRCGDLLEPRAGGLKCERGDMRLASRLEQGLRECFVDRTRVPRDTPFTFEIGGKWWCPGCGVRAEEQDRGDLRCPVCGVSFKEFVVHLVELHPHK